MHGSMTQYFTYGFYVRSFFQKPRSECVPIQYNNAKPKNPVKSGVAGVDVIYFYSISNQIGADILSVKSLMFH